MYYVGARVLTGTSRWWYVATSMCAVLRAR